MKVRSNFEEAFEERVKQFNETTHLKYKRITLSKSLKGSSSTVKSTSIDKVMINRSK